MFANQSYDALVVGARCAGAATAMLMARKGLRVLVIDRAGYGTDTISTHALMRGGVLQLHRWGVLPRLREMGTPAVRETTFHYGDEAIAVPIRPANGVDALYAPRRTLLDSTLVDAAREAGAVVRHGHTLVGLTRDRDGRVCGGTVLDAEGRSMAIRSDLVVGADGIGSSVARLAGAETVKESRNATAVMFGYFRGDRACRLPLVVSAGCWGRRHSNQSRAALHLRCVLPRTLAERLVACRSQRCVQRDPARGRSGIGSLGCRLRAG